MNEEDVQHYAASYGDAAHLRSAFEVYRAIPANIAFNSAHTDAIDVPLLLIGGEHVFGPVMDAVADNLRSHFGWSDVTVSVLTDGRHYVVEAARLRRRRAHRWALTAGRLRGKIHLIQLPSRFQMGSERAVANAAG
jgi:hypothetical protein